MKKFTYIIIGGGMTANAAIKGIREVDSNGSIGLFTSEDTSPYDRPPLTKGLWTEDTDEDEIMHLISKTEDVTLFSNCSVAQISPSKKEITSEDGDTFAYEKLLLATGGSPKTLPFDKDNQIIYFRTLADFHKLESLAEKYDDFAIIGGGFIGSELAAALAKKDKKVALIFPSNGICSRIFPEKVSLYLNNVYQDQNVDIRANVEVTDISGSQGDFTLYTKDGGKIHTEVAVAGIGIQPNVALAKDAGLDVDDGIWVDESLRTSDRFIWAAGDVANYMDTLLGTRRRVEHEDNALSMGEAAGRSMAGEDVSYDHSPMFYSDLFDIGYEAVGQLDSSMQVVTDWKDEFEKGVLYYLDDDKVRGVLLWNVWDKVDDARKLIKKGDYMQPENVKGSIGDWQNQDQVLKETFPASDPPATW